VTASWGLCGNAPTSSRWRINIFWFFPYGNGEGKKTVYLAENMNYKTGKFTWDTLGEVDC